MCHIFIVMCLFCVSLKTSNLSTVAKLVIKGGGGGAVLVFLWQPTVSVPRRRGNCVVQNMHVKQQLYWRDDCPEFEEQKCLNRSICLQYVL